MKMLTIHAPKSAYMTSLRWKSTVYFIRNNTVRLNIKSSSISGGPVWVEHRKGRADLSTVGSASRQQLRDLDKDAQG